MYTKELHKVTVIGLGLLGGSVVLSISNGLPHIEVVGYAHREATRRKARRLGIGSVITGDLTDSVKQADMIIIATPISTYTDILPHIAPVLSQHCIVTDVGSTKCQIHQWARKYLPKTVTFVGSHPLAGAEKQGLEYARDDLLTSALCIVTHEAGSNPLTVKCVCEFWQALGCSIKTMRPVQHDRITATISHVPHVVAAALMNATAPKDLDFAGKGFIDSSRIASGPSNIWSDILLTNKDNICKGIDHVIVALTNLKKIISKQDRISIERQLDQAREKRATMINNKIRRKELL